MKLLLMACLLLTFTNSYSQIREVRTLTIPFDGNWKITYNPNETPVKKTLFKKQIAPTFGNLKANKIDTISIKSLQILVETDKYFVNSHTEILISINKFFSGNRGLYFTGRADLNDALIYTAFFLDLISYNEYKVDFDVIKIEGTDPQGRKLYVDGSRLMKYKPKK